MHVWLFDIDGTLIDTGGAGRRAFEVVLAGEFGVTALNVAARAGRVSFSGRTDRAIAGDLFRSHGIDDSTENWDRFLETYLAELGATLSSGNGQVLPGVAELLEALDQRADCELGLLTGNVQDGAQRKLAHYGLERYFAFGGFGNTFVDRNDVARMAVSAAGDFLSVPTENVRFENIRFHVVGDTPADVRCARSIGATAVAVSTGKFTSEQLSATGPDVCVEDLRDNAPLFELLDGPLLA